MRIISGTHKGKRLIAPKKLPVRPTTDFAKEGLFNILRNRFSFDEIIVLDLYAGTGNISYEFASRGVIEITCVDTHYACISFINRISEELAFPIHTIKSDVFNFLSKSSGTYDIIFADPPYQIDLGDFKSLIEYVYNSKMIKPSGNLIIEHSKHTNLSEFKGYIESRRYGGSVFSFFGNLEIENIQLKLK